MSLKPLLTAVAVSFSVAVPLLAETAEQSAARESLIVFNDRFNALAASHDAEGLIALYDADAFWIAPGARPAQGRDGVLRQTITFMSTHKGALSHTVEDLFISADGTQAVMKGVTKAAVESQGFQLEGTYVYVLERHSEGAPWRIILGMFSQYETD